MLLKTLRHPITIVAIGAVAFLSVQKVFASNYSNDASLLVQQAAIRHHVPVDFALRIAKQETGGKGGRCGLRGAAGEVGPLQILPATARGMGYRGVASATCEAQVDAGMAHLAKCWRHFKIEWMAAACHNQGHRTIQTGKFAKSAKRYAAAATGVAIKTTRKAAHVATEAVTYPVRATTALWNFPRLFGAVTATPAADKPVRYVCNWQNCPKTGN